ncbi:MAG: hypothetical protein IT198_09450, partial [Acidimicrobiia bacterium]|nr:hypothetical protein [Acidimicrobiia bacterium]
HLVELVEQSAWTRTGAPPGEQIGRIRAAILVGGFAELLSEYLAGRIPVSRERLAEDATTLFLALGEAGSQIAADRHGKRK